MRNLRANLIVVFLLAINGCRTAPRNLGDGASPQTEDKSDYQKPSLGVQFSPKIYKIDSKWTGGADSAVRLETVFPYFPADQAGLQSGDFLIAVNGEPFQNLTSDFTARLVQKIRTWPLDSTAKMKIVRFKEFRDRMGGHGPSQQPIDASSLAKSFEKSLEFQVFPELSQIEEWLPHLSQKAVWVSTYKTELTAEIREFDVHIQPKKWSYGDLKINNKILSQMPADTQVEGLLQKKVQSLVEKEKNPQFNTDMEDLLLRLSSLDQYRDALRIPRVGWIFRKPWAIESFQDLQLQRLRACGNNSADFLTCSQRLLLDAGLGSEPSSLFPETSFSSPLEFLQKVVEADAISEGLIRKALAPLDEKELEFIKKESLEIPRQIQAGIYLHENSQEELRLRNSRWMRVVEKVDRDSLFHSLRPLQRLFTRKNFLKLKELIQDSGRSQEPIVEQIIKDQRAYLIGGTANNDYSSHKQYQMGFVFDLGGDDLYPDVGGHIIDWQGSDRYEASRPFSGAAGVLKASWFEDFQGEDFYVCQMGCFGASVLGVSVFIDHQGNDIYRTQNFSLGSSLVGLSLFADFSGSDQYFSTGFSQGTAIAGGFSLMYDRLGDDAYFCKGGMASSYEDPGEFDGWCQGMGLGLRQFVSGGMGLLYDGEGQDRFEGGTFSQGGGYFFGLGALYNDGKQNDIYRGSRYTQGFSAHQAIGLFYEAGGNDHYLSPSFVGQGIAWDLSVTLFADKEGKDFYKTCEHCLGVGSQNSLALFEDLGGEDTYGGEGLPYSSKRYNDYHGGSSLGVFLDQGGAVDKYEKLKNKSSGLYPGWQVLIDQ